MIKSTVPLAVLVRALKALEGCHARLNNPNAPDPYLDVLTSKSELGYYVKKLLEDTPVVFEKEAA